jgi:hypothetical protein
MVCEIERDKRQNMGPQKRKREGRVGWRIEELNRVTELPAHQSERERWVI